MLLSELMEASKERRRYTGEPLETGGTSIQGNAAPALAALYKGGAFEGARKVLDYGAGKYGRNANFLREQGIRVYAYDPFNGTNVDGWEGVSNKLPRGKFDVGFTSFVTNVVPEYIEKQILDAVAKSARTQYHITRNMDIFAMVKKALARRDPLVTQFFLTEFAKPKEKKALEAGTLDDATIMEFCEFGVQTRQGFQRIPTSEDLGLNLLRKTSGFKVYQG